ncbi:MBL fold metallo-hydrolase [Streptomyces xanthii]|uniref:MBL fold metallo-hydrolase n=1 Tax=Streptomyces xanthii TaxID=2768069 RepID=UPI001CB78CDD|nr:MBL fold metallo-hydrolase [Streptomyces xanthii]
MTDPSSAPPAEVPYGAVSVLVGDRRGAFPYGNSLLVRGRDATVVVDPSLSLVDHVPAADMVLVSHGHEDHVAGLGGYDMPVHVHEKDLAAVRSRAAMVASFGPAEEHRDALDRQLRDEFRVADRPDAQGFAEGTVFDLGGRTVTVVHLPGHTAGHCGFLVEPDGFLFVADIDLTSFGPFYGDAGSSLVDFEASLRRCREIDARWYGTAHQKGVIEGAAEFRSRLDAFTGVVERRDATLLSLLDEPLGVGELATHRLVYRPHVEGVNVPLVERRTLVRHLARLSGQGRVEEVEPGLFRSTGK